MTAETARNIFVRGGFFFLLFLFSLSVDILQLSAWSELSNFSSTAGMIFVEVRTTEKGKVVKKF